MALNFNPAEFGKYFIFSNLVTIYTSVVSIPSIQAFRHHYYKQDPVTIQIFYRSLFFWLWIALVVVVSMGSLFQFIPILIGGLMIGQIFSQSNSALNMANINIQGKTILQSIIQIILPCLSAVFVFFMVFFLHRQHFLSLWASNVAAEFCILLITYFSFSHNRFWPILSFRNLLNSAILREYWNFIRPIIMLPVFIWIVNNLDRYILDLFYTKREVGIYAAAYGIGSKIFLLMSGAIIAYYNADVFRQAHDGEHFPELYSRIYKRTAYYFIFGLTIVLFVFLARNLIGKILLSAQYQESFQLVPLLALANLIFSSVFLVEQVIYAIGKTRFILFHYAIGAVTNTVFNFILIPYYGIWGAGTAMVLSSTCQLATVLWLFRRTLLYSTVKS